MTYQDNDPKPMRRDQFRIDPVRATDKESAFWIAGLIGLGIVLALVFWGLSRNTSDTAITRATTTTGSGAAPSPNR